MFHFGFLHVGIFHFGGFTYSGIFHFGVFTYSGIFHFQVLHTLESFTLAFYILKNISLWGLTCVYSGIFHFGVLHTQKYFTLEFYIIRNISLWREKTRENPAGCWQTFPHTCTRTEEG